MCIPAYWRVQEFAFVCCIGHPMQRHGHERSFIAPRETKEKGGIQAAFSSRKNVLKAS
jgi:hypothetical protein